MADLLQPLLASSDKNNASLRKLGVIEADCEVRVTASEVRGAELSCPAELWSLDLSTQGSCKSSPELQRIHSLLSQAHKSLQVPPEKEIRELLLGRAEDSCCVVGPASSWRVDRTEDCSSYVGTLETFVEEREVIDEVEPYSGCVIDGKDKGRVPYAWEVDMKAEIPLLFASHKESKKRIPHTDVVKICEECSGHGHLPCKAVPQFKRCAKAELVLCCLCQERYLVSLGSSDAICRVCSGENRLVSATDAQEEFKTCCKCVGEGALLYRKVVIVRWRTITVRRVCATKNATTVPDKVFQRAKGVTLYQSQSYQCEPADLQSLSELSKFSESIISSRGALPPTAVTICERHQLSLVPVTRVVMSKKRETVKFYIIGLSREIYAADEIESGCLEALSCGLCNIC